MNALRLLCNRTKVLGLLAALLCSYSAEAKDEKPAETEKTGFYYGFGLGAFKANNASADYYINRAADFQSAEQNLWNTTFIEQIENELDKILVLDETGMPYMEFPYIINYKVTVAGTLTGGYYLGKGLSLIGNLTYTRLKANTYFKLFADEPIEKTALDNSVKCIVSAEENRAQIDIGAHQSFVRPKGARPFVEGGICFAFTEVSKHQMNIGNLQIPFSYSEGTSAGSVPVVQPGGASPGVFMSTGIDFPYNDKFKGSVGGGAAIYKVPLEDSSPYLTHFNLFFRVIVQ